MYARYLVLGLLPLSLMGCNPDKDGDGLTKSEEKELGTDPDLADTDGDSLSDGEEVNLGLNPLSADSDNDGVDDGEEIDLGCDPLDPDSDHDGFLDGEEVDNGKDPLNKFSWPEGMGWPDFSEGAPAGTGHAVGDVLPNYTMVDQFGDTFDTNQFHGYVMLIDVSAGWCGPCRAVAVNAQALYEEYRDHGFIIIHNMTDDNSYGGGVTDPNFQAGWAADYGITFPVANEAADTMSTQLYYAGLYEGYIPFMFLVDQNREVVGGYTGSGSETQAEVKIRELLGL